MSTMTPPPEPSHSTTISEEGVRTLYAELLAHPVPRLMMASVMDTGNCSQVNIDIEDQMGLSICDEFERHFYRSYGLSLCDQRGPVLYLAFLTVRPQYRRRGIGRVIYACDHAAAIQWNACEIQMTATQDNLVLFRRWGFKPKDLAELGRRFRLWKAGKAGYRDVDDLDYNEWPEEFLRSLDYIDAVKAVA